MRTDSSTKRRKVPRCERCAGRSWTPILYGYPDERAIVAAHAGDIVLGGCVIEPDAPVAQCRVCGHRPGSEMTWTGHRGPTTGEFGDRWRPLTEDALPTSDAGETELTDFALSFDAYEAVGAETTQRIGSRARKGFERTGAVPDNLVALRISLFFEQRAARFTDSAFDGPYVRALVAAIAEHAARE